MRRSFWPNGYTELWQDSETNGTKNGFFGTGACPFSECSAVQKGFIARLGLATAALLCCAGCASTHSSDPEQSGRRDGISEYRQVADEARSAMRAALNSLAEVSGHAERCPPEVLAAFSAQMQRLQIDSIQLRARAQALQARGDAYFQSWQTHLARVKDPEVRLRAEQRLPELEASFQKIKVLSQEGRSAYEPFVANLRKLRNGLEIDPLSLRAPSTQTCLVMARQDGQHVEECLEGIVRELDQMRELLRPPNNGGKPQQPS